MGPADATGIRTLPAAFSCLVPGVTLYTTAWCGLCARARRLLQEREVEFLEVALDGDPAFRQRVFDLGHQWTVPLVVVGETPIGGYRELVALDREGGLERLLAAAAVA